MFNTTHIHKTEVKGIPMPYCKEVKEIKAPTDESIRMLNEFKEKAKKDIIEAVELKSSIVEAAVIYYNDSPINDSVSFHAKFKINGKEFFIDNKVERYDMITAISQLTHNAVYNLIVKTFSEYLAAEFSKEAFELMNKYKF